VLPGPSPYRQNPGQQAYYKVSHDSFVACPYQLVVHWPTLPFHVTGSELLTASLNWQQINRRPVRWFWRNVTVARSIHQKAPRSLNCLHEYNCTQGFFFFWRKKVPELLNIIDSSC
jgi:hypothetical protein